MIKITYKELLHPQLSMILGKVANTPMAPKQSYEVNKLLGAIRAKRKELQDESTKILRNFVVFEGDRPKFKLDKDGQPTNQVEFIEPYSLEDVTYNSTFSDFEEKVAEIAFRPWSLDMISEIKFSAMELDLLGPLVTDKPYLQAVEEKYSS